jgi:hypothetical protein
MKKKYLILIIILFFLFPFLKAQVFNFNPTTKIFRIKSEHFEVLFPKGYEKLAFKAIRIGENRFKVLSEFFNWQPKKRVIIAFFPNYDYSNGFTMVAPYNFIGVIPYPPASSSELSNYEEWLNILLTHELSHVFHLDQSKDLAKFFRTILGNAPTSLVFPQFSNSIAFIEGIAVYSESKNTKGGRLNSSDYLAYIKNNVLFDNFPPFDRIYGGTKFFPGMSSSYIYGSYMIDYIAKTKQWENIKKAINISSKIPMIYGPELAVLMLTDHMPWTHYTLMKKYYKEKFKNLKLNIVRISKDRFRKRNLEYFKDKLYYIEKSPFSISAIVEYNIKTGGKRKLVKKYQIKTLSFNHEDKKLYFSAINRVKNYYIFSDIYYYDTKNGKIKRISKGKRLSFPCYYKKDSIFAVRRGKTDSRIILYDINSKKIIKEYPKFEQISFLTIDDKKTNLFFIGHKNNHWDIYSLNLETDELSKITNSLSIEKYLKYRNGRLYFVSQTKEEQSLFSYDIENHKFYKLFTSVTDIRGFAFNKDSLYLLSIYGNGVEIVKPNRIETIEFDDYNDLKETIEKKEEIRANKIKPKIKKTNLLKYYIPKFWLPAFKEVDGRYLWGPSTFSFDPYGRHFLYGGIFYNPSASKLPSFEFDLTHYFWYLPLSIEYTDTSSKNTTLGDYREINFKVGTFYRTGDYYRRLRLSANYVYEARKKTIYKYKLSGFSANLNYDTTKQFPLSISREDGILFSAGYRKNLKVLGSDFNLSELFVDFRSYISGAYLNQVLAFKFGFYNSFGDGIKLIGVGGNKSQERYPSVFNPSVELQRAYNSSSFYGNKIFSFSAELRNPIARIERGFKFYPILISQIYSSIFVDWSRIEWEGEKTKMPLSVGAEISMDVRIQYRLSLTLTMGIAFSSSVNEPVKPRYYFRIGKSF